MSKEKFSFNDISKKGKAFVKGKIFKVELESSSMLNNQTAD